MGSLLVHIGLGLLVALALRAKHKSLLLFGSILPDIKIFLYLIATPLLGLTAANELIIPVHSLFGGFLLAVFFSSLLPRQRFKEALVLMSTGVLCHFVIDASIYPFFGIEHYLLLYPFSWAVYGLEASDYVNLFTVLSIPIVFFFTYRNRKYIINNMLNGLRE